LVSELPYSVGSIEPEGTKKLCTTKAFVRAARDIATTTIRISSSHTGMRLRARGASGGASGAAVVDTSGAYVSPGRS
jgi:hypothetical protein